MSIDQKIINFIKEELIGPAKNVDVSPDEDLLTGGLIESLGMVRLIQFLETEYDFTVPPQDMTIDHFITVQAMVDYVASKTS